MITSQQGGYIPRQCQETRSHKQDALKRKEEADRLQRLFTDPDFPASNGSL